MWTNSSTSFIVSFANIQMFANCWGLSSESATITWVFIPNENRTELERMSTDESGGWANRGWSDHWGVRLALLPDVTAQDFRVCGRIRQRWVVFKFWSSRSFNFLAKGSSIHQESKGPELEQPQLWRPWYWQNMPLSERLCGFLEEISQTLEQVNLSENA